LEKAAARDIDIRLVSAIGSHSRHILPASGSEAPGRLFVQGFS
jgi:hypothetical protein